MFAVCLALGGLLLFTVCLALGGLLFTVCLALGGLLFTVCLALGGLLFTVCLALGGLLFTVCLALGGLLFAVCLALGGLLFTVCLALGGLLFTVCLALGGLLFTVCLALGGLLFTVCLAFLRCHIVPVGVVCAHQAHVYPFHLFVDCQGQRSGECGDEKRCTAVERHWIDEEDEVVKTSSPDADRVTAKQDQSRCTDGDDRKRKKVTHRCVFSLSTSRHACVCVTFFRSLGTPVGHSPLYFIYICNIFNVLWCIFFCIVNIYIYIHTHHYHWFSSNLPSLFYHQSGFHPALIFQCMLF